MASTSSHTCFFSFGPDDSFISKSYEGLRYHGLPPALRTLIAGGTVRDVHWATLGPTPSSWLLSYSDSTSTPRLAWGPSLPPRLTTLLSKHPPTPHLRVTLGPSASYIAWSPSFIHWSNLPPPLEDTLQSWLTPSGWRAGPPRIVTWGPADAFFAASEYGEVAYGVGSGESGAWGIWRETVEEWRGEAGFRWDGVVCVALDATATGEQFVALREDGTWAGSIADENAAALEAFARNFFRRERSRAKSPDRAYEQRDEPDAAEKAAYQSWATATALLFASALAATSPSITSTSTPTATTIPAPKRPPKKLQIRSPSSSSSSSTSTPPRPASVPLTNQSTLPPTALLTTFPYLPLTPCALPPCILTKADPTGLRACKHDVERALRAGGSYSYEWLKKERLRWHPDRFGRLCAEAWREEGRRVSAEMFKVVGILIGEVEGGGNENGNGRG